MVQTRYVSDRPLQRLGIGLALLLMAACTSVPFDYPREGSYQEKAATTGSLSQLGEAWLQGQTQRTAVYPLASGTDAYQVRLDIIDRAQATIDAQYFLIKPDAAGVGFSGALLRAADRGVRVRVLLDDIFTTAGDEGLALLSAHENVQVRLFNPLSRQGIATLNYMVDFKRANRRMHNKSLTVDGLVTIIGGRNIAGEYFDMNPKVRFWDFETLSFGGLIPEVSDSFDIFWNHKLSVPMQAFKPKLNNSDLQKVRAELTAWQQAHPLDEFASDGIIQGLLDHRLTPYYAEVHVVSDHPDKLVNPVSPEYQTLAQSLGDLLASAESEILVFSPYFIPSKGMAEELVKLSQRGVNVVILTNSLASTNHVAVHSGYKRYRKTLLQGGVTLVEVSASGGRLDSDAVTTLHTKAILVDREWLFVGSLNVDPRSIEINTEMGLIAHAPELARDLSNAAEKSLRDVAYLVELKPDGSLQWRASTEEGDVIVSKEPESSWWRRFSVGFYGLLPIESQL
jgi:putative cardiolipin synthase